MSKDLVKQDIGFLEYPLWFQDERMAEQREEGFLWQDREGFIYRAGYKPPVKIDRLFLLYLTLKSQHAGWKEELELSRFEILKECQVGTGKREYERLEDSLKRWKMVGIEFKGTFYDGKSYHFINFGIIDDWEIEQKTKKLKVRFSSRWLQQQRNSTFFKLINFDEIKALRSPLTIRLYEILIKTFQGRDLWEINNDKLAGKIPMDEKYPADIIPKIKTAVNRINEFTELKIELEIKRPQRGKAIFVFKKLSNESKSAESLELPKVIDVPEEKQEALERLLGLVREKERGKKTVLEMISMTLRKQNEEYVTRNILYANKHAKTHFRAYLSEALKNDWAGEELAEPEEKNISQEQQNRRELTPEEVEAEVQVRLSQMDATEVQWRMKEARIALAKERVKDDPHIHPNDISQQDVQNRMLRNFCEEVHRILVNSQR